MHRLRMGAFLWGAVLSLGCDTKIAHTTEEPPNTVVFDGGTEASAETDAMAPSESPTAACGGQLSARLTVTEVSVGSDIRYKQLGYNYVPTDHRIALAVQPNGAALVAWLDNDLEYVHVTPLSADQTRSEHDVLVAGVDLGGLVAHDDAFALLTRRADPGEPLTDPNVGGLAKAAFLVQVRGGKETFAAPLTGTAALTDYPADRRRDCAEPSLGARLAFNGTHYGAYFTVHGCSGHWAESHYADKLAYIDTSGHSVARGWDWKCSINQGLRLLPELDGFTAVCLSDSQPSPGLNLVGEGTAARQLAVEETWNGYCAGQLGSIVRMGDSYLVGWLSRGAVAQLDGGPARAAKAAPDIALVRFRPGEAPSGRIQWLLETPDLAEANLHLAPYGPDRILVLWDSIANLHCRSGTCLGDYAGTHARLIDANGTFLTPDETLDAPPNGDDDLAVYPNGDVAWAFVPETPRNYATTLSVDGAGRPSVPAKRQIRIARLRYCSD